MPDSQMSASVSEAIAMWISGDGKSKSWILMRFWMPDCCWQLGLGPIVSRNQEGCAGHEDHAGFKFQGQRDQA